MEKLNRKENLDKKLKEEIAEKKKNEEQKREALEDRIRSLLRSKEDKAFKNRTMSPKNTESKDHNQSRMSIKLTKSIDRDDISERLKSLNEKFDKSNELHQLALKEKTIKISWHTQKVNQLLHNLVNTKDQTSLIRAQQFVNKLHGAESRREKNKSEISEKLKKQQEKLIDKHSKIKHNQEEEIRKEQKRINKIEEKMNTTIQNMRAKNKEIKFERELKFERNKLKGEDTLENVARIKKTELKKKLKILEKHQELDKRLEILKEEKDKINEKKRDDAHKTVIEKIKLKDLKLVIEKTKDSTKMNKILNKFYQNSNESSELLEEPIKEEKIA